MRKLMSWVRRIPALAGVELVWALSALPCLILLFVFFLWPWSIPILAQLARFSSRFVGAAVPSPRRDQSFGSWLAVRVTDVGFWRSDVPIVLCSTLLSVVSFVIAFFGVVLGGLLAVLPFFATPNQPLTFFGNVRVYEFTSVVEVWWLIPCGLGILAVTAAILAALGSLRFFVVTALSHDPREVQVEELTGAVEGLRSGRVTLVDAFEAERTRIERDLHDGAQQRMLAVTMLLGEALQDNTEAQRRRDLVEQAQVHAQGSLRELRETVRGIHPAVLTDLGLGAAVADLCAQSPLGVALTISGESTPSPPVATAVYFAISETLTNIARHSKVDTAQVTLHLNQDRVEAVVHDSGVGGAVVDPHKPTGLSALAQRLDVVGGTLRLDSPSGDGTTVIITAPLVPPW